MKCPVCVQPDLVLAERQGIEIDYCPACRGVWLDRGELDKLIERSGTMAQPEPYRAPAPPPPDYDRDRDRYRDDDYYKRKRKKSWLEDIFD